jgi:hypothetical protein
MTTALARRCIEPRELIETRQVFVQMKVGFCHGGGIGGATPDGRPTRLGETTTIREYTRRPSAR